MRPSWRTSAAPARCKTIVSFLEREQRAEIGVALDIVNEVFARSQQAGVVTAVDWDRTAGTELVLRKQHRQVLAELLDRLSTSGWTGQPEADAGAMREVGPARVRELLDLLRLLAGGLWRWEEVNVLYRLASEAVTVGDLASQEQRLVLLQQQHDEVLNAIVAVRKQAAQTRARSNWSRLWSDGIVLGERHDTTNMARVAEGRKQLKAAAAPSRNAVHKSFGSLLELAAA